MTFPDKSRPYYRKYEKLKEFELFAIQPAPQFEGRGRYGTPVGLIVTLIVVGITIAYSVFTISRLVLNQRASLVRTTAPDSPPFPMEPFSLELPWLNDRSYFRVLVEHRQQAPGQSADKQALKLVQASVNDLSYGVHPYNTELPEQWIYGDCRVVRCEYIRVKVYPCQNGTGIACQNADTINNIVNNNYLLLTLYGKTPEGDPNKRTYELSLKNGLSWRQRFLYDTNTEKYYPNYLSSWSKDVIDTLQLQTPIFSIDRLPRPTEGEDTEYCKMDFGLSGSAILQRRYFQTSLDTIGEIAAFFAALTGIAALFVTSYNEKVFYTKYPSWTNFDRYFTQLPPGQEPTPADDKMMEPVAQPAQAVMSRRGSGQAGGYPSGQPEIYASGHPGGFTEVPVQPQPGGYNRRPGGYAGHHPDGFTDMQAIQPQVSPRPGPQKG
jgi:hypothetical protein